MSTIRVFSGSYCSAEEIIDMVSNTLKYEFLDDEYIVAKVSQRFNIHKTKLLKTLDGKLSAFNSFTHERECNLSFLKLIVSEIIEKDEILLSGFCTHFIPSEISHVLRVCIISDFNHRLEKTIRETGLTQKEATKILHKDDEKYYLWTNYLLSSKPWDHKLYDILIPTNKIQIEDAFNLICDNARKDFLKPTQQSVQAVKDFMLASKVEVELIKSGHFVSVSAINGKITLTINKNTLMLSRLEDELKKLVAKVKGVEDVATKVGSEFYKVNVYRQIDPELPNKVLLVDDEIEFVQTLSERLLMREIGSAVVYDGEQALSFVEEEEPEVIVIDLKMPGIDGIEVLKRVKSKYPNIEVIVLTGHGSEKDRETCMDLGAFAYLEKPVDIENLSKVMQDAYKMVKLKMKRNE
jgi:two-component system, OmpR family, response regulator CpxR